jgi:hypothetical protein
VPIHDAVAVPRSKASITQAVRQAQAGSGRLSNQHEISGNHSDAGDRGQIIDFYGLGQGESCLHQNVFEHIARFAAEKITMITTRRTSLR